MPGPVRQALIERLAVIVLPAAKTILPAITLRRNPQAPSPADRLPLLALYDGDEQADPADGATPGRFLARWRMRPIIQARLSGAGTAAELGLGDALSSALIDAIAADLTPRHPPMPDSLLMQASAGQKLPPIELDLATELPGDGLGHYGFTLTLGITYYR